MVKRKRKSRAGRGFKSRGASVREVGDYLWVTIFNDGRTVFKGGCPASDEDKVKDLVSLLRKKGVSFPEFRDGWW